MKISGDALDKARKIKLIIFDVGGGVVDYGKAQAAPRDGLTRYRRK